jgi:16S rRNA (cytidine1402-2'-O)-methyltransferase
MVQVVKNNAQDGPKLYICSTPIGNLSDVSERLVATLQSVDIVACEDTRHTRKLLTHYDIHPSRLISYHQHNEHARQDWMATAWEEGQSIALVSDAGTPLLSDPGALLVDTAIEHGIPVIPVPGPSALLAALVGSGMPMTPFVYL